MICAVCLLVVVFRKGAYTVIVNEVVICIKRPVIMNGIGDLITRQDLSDRGIIIELPAINHKKENLIHY